MNPITTSHPPKAFLRLVVNPILARLLHTPFAGAARHQFMVVDFNGRKSGHPYSLVLTAHLIDGILYALTGATWKANFRDGAPAQVLHDGEDDGDARRTDHRHGTGRGSVCALRRVLRRQDARNA